MIIGPYNSAGNQWGCDRDVCNGNFVDGSYVYVGSSSFPYVVGCWGPGPDPVVAPSCTTNGCSSRTSSGGEGAGIGGSSNGGTSNNNNSFINPTGENGENQDFAFSSLVTSFGLFSTVISTLFI